MGEGCKEGEYILHFELEITKNDIANPIFTSFGDLTVSEKLSISQLKNLIFENWEDMSISALSFLEDDNIKFPEAPLSAKHLRLRDFKGGKTSGPLRDDRLIGRCLLG